MHGESCLYRSCESAEGLGKPTCYQGEYSFFTGGPARVLQVTRLALEHLARVQVIKPRSLETPVPHQWLSGLTVVRVVMSIR